MIIEHYPNPNKPVKAVHVPTTVVYSPAEKGPDMANGHGLRFNQHWADKLGIPLHEYIAQDRRIQDAAQKCNYDKNAVVFPTKLEDYQRLGKCRILDVCRSRRDWPEDWQFPPEGGALYIVEAVSEENKFNIFRATKGFFSLMPPLGAYKPIINEDGVIG